MSANVLVGLTVNLMAKTLLKMKPFETLAAHWKEVRAIVLAQRAFDARVFGSELLGFETEESDLGIVIGATSDATPSGLGFIRDHLRSLLGTPVDVVTPNGLPDRTYITAVSEAFCS